VCSGIIAVYTRDPIDAAMLVSEKVGGMGRGRIGRVFFLPLPLPCYPSVNLTPTP